MINPGLSEMELRFIKRPQSREAAFVNFFDFFVGTDGTKPLASRFCDI